MSMAVTISMDRSQVLVVGLSTGHSTRWVTGDRAALCIYYGMDDFARQSTAANFADWVRKAQTIYPKNLAWAYSEILVEIGRIKTT